MHIHRTSVQIETNHNDVLNHHFPFPSNNSGADVSVSWQALRVLRFRSIKRFRVSCFSKYLRGEDMAGLTSASLFIQHQQPTTRKVLVAIVLSLSWENKQSFFQKDI
eukprot:COSAG06_NODE_8705_length_2092_cov_1.343703_1_plen_106_part_10